ncbi:MAG TPA: 30S ribosomal protein S12 methylthiotransferase RimO [Nitrospiria bacterium]|nr:30S ribosomal protein S12 methylthiotransferase RimO [Nitrospiria bacterium]
MPVPVAVVTLGCPKNQVDSEVMQGLLAKEGFRLVEKPEQAAVLVVNTCGFIDAAKEESVDTLLQLAKLKKKGKCELLIAAGCLAQRYPEELINEIQELDGVVGTGDFQKIAELCREKLKPAHDTAPVSFTEHVAFLYDAATPRRRIGANHTAYVKVAEGCNYRCSFCAIPSFRGDLKSRSIDSVVKEVEQLAKEGVKEINLIAQSLTSYGWDWRTNGNGSAKPNAQALPQLLKRLAPIKGVEWLRLFYTYPTDFSDGLIELMANEPKLCKYVDLPLQHINDRILKAMNRKGKRKEIEQLIDRLRRSIPDLSLRTTFIVGFPGEGEAEFEELADFVRETGFDRIGVFTYSPEEGTAAFPLGDPVTAEQKTERRQRLLDLQEEIAGDRLSVMIGRKLRVLIDGLSEDGSDRLEARHQGQAPEIDGVVMLEKSKKQPSPGDLVTVEVTDTVGYDLIGRVTT